MKVEQPLKVEADPSDLTLLVEVAIRPRNLYRLKVGLWIVRFGAWIARLDVQTVPSELLVECQETRQ